MFITDDGIDVRTLSGAQLDEEISNAIKTRSYFDLEALRGEANRRAAYARHRLNADRFGVSVSC